MKYEICDMRYGFDHPLLTEVANRTGAEGCRDCDPFRFCSLLHTLYLLYIENGFIFSWNPARS
jgi:hypothetical protein